MTTRRGIGTYVAQGWAANALLTYLLCLGWALYRPAVDEAELMLIALPIYGFFIGSVGAVVGAVVWIFEFALQRRMNVVCRGLVGVLLPITLTAVLAALGGFLHETETLLWVIGMLAFLVLFPVVLAGTRFNPLSVIVMDLQHNLPDYGRVRAITLTTVPMLRILSVFGLLEAFLFLAYQRSPELGAWDFTARHFLGAIAAVIYFAITLIVALCRPKRIVALTAGIITNLPIAAFAFTALQNLTWNNRVLSFICGSLIISWGLFLLSEANAKTRRLFPVTMFEIRVRHALNYW